jgi:hypothetical protein
VKVATKPPRLPNPICQPVPTERRKCPATKDNARLTLDDRDRKRYRLTVAVEPADDDGHGGIYTGNCQEESTVFDVVVVLDTEKRRESSEGDEEGEKNEKETVFCKIGARGDKHSKDEGASPRWDGQELGPDCAVTERLDDSGREVGI